MKKSTWFTRLLFWPAVLILGSPISARAQSSVNLANMFWGPSATVTNSSDSYLPKYNAAPNYNPGYAYAIATNSILIVPPTSSVDFLRLRFWNPVSSPSGNYYLSASYALASVGAPADVDVLILVTSQTSWSYIDHFRIRAGDNFSRNTYLGNWPDLPGFSISVQMSTTGANNWWQSVYFYNATLQPVTSAYYPAAPVPVIDQDTTALPLAKPSSLPNLVDEAPPVLASTQTPGAWTSIYHNTSYSYVCNTGSNPLQTSVQLSSTYCADATLPAYESSPQVQIAPSAVRLTNPWMLNYNGIFGAHVLWDRYNQNYWVLTVNHNETKNEVRGGELYQNPFSPDISSDLRHLIFFYQIVFV